MKRITVNAYEVALVSKRGKVVEVLTEGKYWMFPWKRIEYCDITKPLHSAIEFSILLENMDIQNMLEVVTVNDNEIGLEYKDGVYSKLLQPGRFAYWKSPVNYTVEKYNLTEGEVPASIPERLLRRAEIKQYLTTYVVESYEKGLLYIDGEFKLILEPGVYKYWNTVPLATIRKVDTRIQNMEVSGQEILTKDKAGIRINFQAQYRVVDIEKAEMESKDATKQLYINLQLAIREYVGTMTLDQLLAKKEEVDKYVMKAAKTGAKLLGMELISGGIKDIILPGDIKEIMNQVLVAQKKAQANTIMRQEETASTRSLLNTAKLMEQNQMLLKLKEMEYVEKIAEKVGEITLSGGSQVLDQLTDIFVAQKN